MIIIYRERRSFASDIRDPNNHLIIQRYLDNNIIQNKNKLKK